MADLLHQELIRQAVEAARAKDRETALNLLKEVLDEDEDNVTAWLLFARVTQSEEQKRHALETVLEIDPENKKAKEHLAKLEVTVKAKRTQAVEIAPGVSKQIFRLVAGGIVGIVVVLILLVVIIQISKKSKESSEEKSLTQQAATQIELAAQLTQDAVLAQTEAFDATQTQIARITPTPTPTPSSGLPTLPPSFTPSPTQSNTGPEPLAPPAGITGIISGWSGRDLLNSNSLPKALYTLTGEAAQVVPQILEGASGQHVFLSPDNTRLVYSRFLREDSTLDVTLVNLRGERIPSPLDQAPTYGPYLVSSMPAFSADGTKIVFVADTLDSFTSEVILVDLTLDKDTATIRLTDDAANYSYPSFSPDGSKVVAVRSNPTSPEHPGPDLVIIDVASLTLSALSNDDEQIRETMPRWAPDGGIIAFAGITEQSEEDQYDLYIIAVDRVGSGTVVVDDPVNAIYPIYSPDGQYLAFASNRNGFYEIYIFDLVSRDLYQVTNSQEEDYPGNWIALDGD